jgi:hypothetical protein
MSAPIGNKFWENRAKHGRDLLFATPELLWDAATEYFEWCENNPIQDTRSFGGQAKVQRPFTMQGLCLYLGCNTAYFRQFKEVCSKDFSTIVLNIEETVYQQKFELAAIGILKENIIARDLGLSEKIKQDIVVEKEIDFSNLSDEDLLNLATTMQKLNAD